MNLLRKRDIPEERYTNAFLGYGPEDNHFLVELTYSKSISFILIFKKYCPLDSPLVYLLFMFPRLWSGQV